MPYIVRITSSNQKAVSITPSIDAIHSTTFEHTCGNATQTNG